MTTNPLIVVDLGHTLGHVVGRGAHPAEILKPLTPYGYHHRLVDEEVKRVLNVVPELHEEVVRQICDRLLIPVDEWPDPWQPTTFEFYEDAHKVLRELNNIGPVVALTNQPVTAHAAMHYVAAECGSDLKEIFTSYNLGDYKPARWLWKYVADHMRHKVSDIIHIGDQYTEDVLAPLSAGALGAVWVHADAGDQVGNRWERVTLLRNTPDAVRRLLGTAA